MALLVLPLVVSAALLLFDVGDTFVPTSDIALIEMQVRDVGRHAVWKGLYSRVDWSHPGPAQFFLLAPFSWLTGGSPVGPFVGALAINAAALVGMVAVAQVGLWFGLLGVPYLAARFFGDGMRREFGLTIRRPDLPVGGLWGVFGQLVIFPLVYLPLMWFTDITQEEFSEPAQNMADKATSPAGVVLLVLIVGVGAPIIEEIFYRGLLQGSLVRRLGPVWGIGIASVVFGLVHFQVLQFPALALAGPNPFRDETARRLGMHRRTLQRILAKRAPR